MKEVFVNRSLTYLKNNNACDEKQVNIFRYTLESIYSLVTKTVTVLLLSIVLGTFKITLIALILYSLLRGFTFGIHATKNSYCWFITLSVYIIFPWIMKQIAFPTFFLFLSECLGFIAILFWAPADTPKRPLIHKKKRMVNKIISAILSIVFIILAYFSKEQNFKEIIAFILLLNTVCICPLTYWLFHIRYNNYKYYKN